MLLFPYEDGLQRHVSLLVPSNILLAPLWGATAGQSLCHGLAWVKTRRRSQNPAAHFLPIARCRFCPDGGWASGNLERRTLKQENRHGVQWSSCGAIVQTGLRGKTLNEDAREWWASFCGWLAMVAFAWAAVFGVSLFGGWLIAWISDPSARTALATSWLGVTVAGVLAGKDPLSGGTFRRRALACAAQVAPYVFLIGLFALVSFLVSRGESRALSQPQAALSPEEQYWRALLALDPRLLLLLVAGGMLLVIGIRFVPELLRGCGRRQHNPARYVPVVHGLESRLVPSTFNEFPVPPHHRDYDHERFVAMTAGPDGNVWASPGTGRALIRRRGRGWPSGC
jgi:hypothetical protein